MDAVIRGAVTYLVVWLILRLAGKRSLADITAFDFVLLLIIAETTQPALTARNNSLTNMFLLIVTLVGIDIGLSLWKQRSKVVGKVLDGTPLVLLENGVPMPDRLRKCRVDESDILTAARERLGLERLDQIKYAVLERSGGISVIPMEGARAPRPRRRRRRPG
ncbi:MAG TPA: YetF domain-containing protein [Gemmataceae bacterium]